MALKETNELIEALTTIGELVAPCAVKLKAEAADGLSREEVIKALEPLIGAIARNQNGVREKIVTGFSGAGDIYTEIKGSGWLEKADLAATVVASVRRVGEAVVSAK